MAENAITEEKVVNERVKNGLRKMIKSFDSYMKEAADYEQLEDNLKHMEETDENFHRYDLVEFLRDRIETNLGDSIEKHVNDAFSNIKFDGDIDLQNRLAQKICDDIIKTKDVYEFKNSFKSSVIKANEFLTKNFYSNFIESNSEEVTLLDNENKSITFTNDIEYSSPDNSMNQNSFVFFTSEQFPAIAQNLDPKKPDQVRLRAIQQLLAIPASDPQAADHWVDIRKYLNYAFRDPDDKISELCIKLHSRTLASSHYKVSCEIYINLVEHLSEYFKEKELEKRMFRANIDITNPENSFILKIFRLLNDYAKDVTSKWARYPDSFIETIINETLKLLSLGIENKFGAYMTPVHYLSLLDIQSNWFSKWMLQTAIYSIILYSTTNARRVDGSNIPRSNSDRKKSSSTNSLIGSSNLNTKRTTFRKIEIEYAHFVHSLNVIRKILCFKNGRRLFPVMVANKEVTIKDLIKILIQIIFDTASNKTANDFCPSKYAYDLLQDLCVAEEGCNACFCNEEVIDHLLKPLKTLILMKKQNPLASSSASSFSSSSQGSNIYYDESCMLMIANVLSKLASTDSGYRQLLFNDSKQNFFDSSNKSSAAHIIASFVRKALTNQLNYSLSTSEIAEYLYLVRLLYSQCQGVFLIKEYNLNKCIGDSWHLIERERNQNIQISSVPNTPRTMNSNISLSPKDLLLSTWSESLLDNLISMASTPKGVFYLNETDLLGQVINYMFSRYKSKMQVGKYEKFGYGFIISELSNSPSGCYHLNDVFFIQSLIDEIWTELEYGTDDFMSAFPRAYSVESIDREVYKPMLCLLNVLSSFSSVYELLADMSATPRSFYGIRDVPKGLVGLLDRVAFLDKKIKISSLCNYEQSHIFGLKLISILQSDLDVLLLLESQYNLTNILINLQKSNRPLSFSYDFNNENDDAISESPTNEDDNDNYEQLKNVEETTDVPNIMIDALSVERNFVLVNSNIIGGPNEKLLPSKQFNDPKSFSYDFPLFDKLPVPNCFIKKPEITRYQTDNEFFEFIGKFNYDQIIKNEESLLNWLSSFRSLYLACLKSSNLGLDVMGVALNQFVQVLFKQESDNLISSIDSKTNIGDFVSRLANNAPPAVTPLQKLGIEKTIQYGIQINQIQKLSKEDNLTNLTEIHKFVKQLLRTSNSNSKKSHNQKTNSLLAFCQEEYYPGYDWFTSSIYLLNKGDSNATQKFLYNFHFLQMSSILWSSRLYLNDFLLSNVYTKNGINILLPTTCHYIELILKIELPLIFSAFRMSGLSPSQICSNWLKQCFWNYLDWIDIVTYISICVIYGIDYQTYFCVAILKHLNKKSNDNTADEASSSLPNSIDQNIVQHHTDRDLQIYLKESQIENFKIENYIDFMFELERKYRQYILDDIKQVFTT